VRRLLGMVRAILLGMTNTKTTETVTRHHMSALAREIAIRGGSRKPLPSYDELRDLLAQYETIECVADYWAPRSGRPASASADLYAAE
jgi:hypothetical protein